MGDDANSRYWSLKKSCSTLELLRGHIWNCYCTVRDVALEIYSAEEDWTMQQQYTPSVGVRCNGVLWSLSCFYGITHAPFMYWIFSTQQWVSVWVSESERVGEIFEEEWRGGFMSYQSSSIFSAWRIMVRYLLILWKENWRQILLWRVS